MRRSIVLDMAIVVLGGCMAHQQSGAAQAVFIMPIQFGVAVFALLLAIYFGVVSLISGMDFASGSLHGLAAAAVQHQPTTRAAVVISK